MCMAAVYFDSDCEIAFHEQWLIYSLHLHSWLCLLPQACLLNPQSSSLILKNKYCTWDWESPCMLQPLLFSFLSCDLSVQIPCPFFFYWFACLLLRAIGTPYILRKICLCAICCNFYLVSLFIFWICSWHLFFCHAEKFYVIKFIYTVISFMALWIFSSIGQGIHHSKN